MGRNGTKALETTNEQRDLKPLDRPHTNNKSTGKERKTVDPLEMQVAKSESGLRSWNWWSNIRLDPGFRGWLREPLNDL